MTTTYTRGELTEYIESLFNYVPYSTRNLLGGENFPFVRLHVSIRGDLELLPLPSTSMCKLLASLFK